MTTMTVSSKGWVVIPKEYRAKYGFAPGRRVAFVDYGGVLSILPVPDDPVADGLGILRPFTADTSLTEALLRERAADLEREEQEFDRHLRA